MRPRYGWVLLLVFLTACAPKMPEKSFIDPQYSLSGIQTVSIQTKCDQAKVTGLDKTFVHAYCDSLNSGLKLAFKYEFPKFMKLVEEGPADLDLHFELEQLHGGDEGARFWIGFGAGRSVSTVYLTAKRDGKVIMEKRINETTTMPDIVGGAISNEETLVRDIGLVARRLLKHAKDPWAEQRERERQESNSYSYE